MNNEIRALAQQLLHGGLGPLPERDRRVIARVARRLQTRNLNQEFEEHLTVGQKLADRVAVVGGSWGFIISFGAFLIGWALLNGVLLANHALDPYPFMFLNLMLSMLAAFQAPIIMMSQNRQAAKDRMAAALDYEVNLKAEFSIAELHTKLDRLQASLAVGEGAAASEPPAAPLRAADVQDRELVDA